MEIARNRLVGRARRARARVLFVVAPAGYGKSTFMRQLLPAYASWTICDLAGARDGLDVARRIVSALGRARPEKADAIAQAQISLPNEFDEWRAFVHGIWSERSVPEAFVFENAEVLEIVFDGASLFHDLLRDNPRVVITCTRVSLELPYGHGLAPSDVLVVRQEDLRFSSKELDEALPNLDAEGRSAVERVSRGWPVVVSLIARLLAEGDLPDLLGRLDDVVHDQLYEYLASQLIASLPSDQLEVVLTLAAISDATRADIERALKREVYGDLQMLRGRVPMSVDAKTGAMQLHPMLAQMLLRQYSSLCEGLVRASASGAAAAGDDIRAARLYLAIGDKRAAASAIKDVGAFLTSTPSPGLAEVLSSLDGKILLEFPALWCAAIMHRGYSITPHDWLRTARHIWDHLPSGAETQLRHSVMSTLLNAQVNIGLCEEASKLLDGIAAETKPGDQATEMMIVFWRSVLVSYEGRYEELSAYMREVMPILAASDLTHALYLYDVIAPMHQARGDWQRANETLGQARELAAPTRLGVTILPTVESAFAAWFSGNDELFERYMDDYEALVKQYPWTIRGHRFFIACARGRGAGVPYGYEKTKTRAQAAMIAGALSKPLSEAQSFAREAVAIADASSRRYLRVIARVALAELVPEERGRLLTEAWQISETLQSRPMGDALHALRSGRDDVGMLSPFIARFRHFHSQAPIISVRVLAGEVSVGGVPVKLSPSEFAVVATLAHQRRWYDAAELCEDLYPELDSEAAGNRLYVYVHRARQRLGHDAIVGSRSGYRLGPSVTVDLWEAEALIRDHRGQGAPLSDDERARVGALTPLSRAELTALTGRARLPIAFECRVGELHHDLLLLGAKDALDGGRMREALTFADALIADDPCDEEANSCRIRAFLLQEDRHAAEAAWRSYGASLRAQAGIEPPPFDAYLVPHTMAVR
ncbi:MAG: transcriptional activator domain protein [Candidatus Eremiobacteraeota bacterium]|nr:transcriptional activator domain protein [Candidatus Eremiobacteraeota bacterium]